MGGVTSIFRTIVFLLFLGIVSTSVTRKVVSQAWPGCDNNKKCAELKKTHQLPNVVYTKASAPGPQHDMLHYVFSTKEALTVLIARTTDADTSMVFNWDIILQNNTNTSLHDAITFTNKPVTHYRFGLCFSKLIEYDDISDDATISKYCDDKDGTHCKITPFSEFEHKWDKIDEKQLEKDILFSTTDLASPSVSLNGTLSFSFTIPEKAGRVSAQPAQKYIANETLFEFLMDNFTPYFNNSRFALEAIVVSLEKSDVTMKVETIKTIDDEYSPGVFQLTNLLTNPADNSQSGFVQWKPVAYFGKKRGRMTSTKIKTSHLEDIDATDKKILDNSLISALFKEVEMGDGTTDSKKLTISFGQQKDGFYNKNDYTSWNGAIGYGTPPKDEISMTVIAIISAGLGLPVLICILGGIYTIMKAMRKKGSQYEPISGNSQSLGSDTPQVN